MTTGIVDAEFSADPLPALYFIDSDGTQIRLDTDHMTWGHDPTPLTRRRRLMAFALIDLAMTEGRLKAVETPARPPSSSSFP